MTVLVSVLMAPAILYLAFRYYYISQKQWKAKGVLKFVIPAILCSFYIFPLSGGLDFYLTGGIDVMGYPHPVTYWFWFGLVFVFQLATALILADAAKFLSRFTSLDQQRIGRYHGQIAMLLFVIIFSYTAWKVYHDTTQIVTDKQTVKVEGLPASLEGFKIMHITDIQGDEYTGREDIARYIKKVNQQQPDLIIFTGDLISYGTDYIKMAAEELGKARAKYGVIAVVGDHDYWAGTENIERALSNQKIPLLRDQNYALQIDSLHSALITGVTQVYSKDSNPETVDSLMAVSGDPSLKIFASHQVKGRLISGARQHNYDLMLAGHTHGGQIRVPFMGMSFSASERETRFVSGMYHEEGMPIHVNNGLGFTLGPIRYDAPPEVTVLMLTGSDN